LLPRTEESNKPYKNDDQDGKGLWRSGDLLVRSYSESAVYPIINPNTGESFLPAKGSCWRASKETMQQWLKENRIYFGKDGKGAPQLKRYLNEVQQGIVPGTWWTFDEVGHNDAANKELQAIFNTKTPFDTPKPSSLIKRMLIISSSKDDIILDFFAGSGTTGHAVMDLNKEDGGNRKYILVQLPEKTDNPEFPTIADITRERVRRVIKKYQADDHNESLGFKAYQLAKSNFTVWQGSESDMGENLALFIDHVNPDRSREDILYELLLKAGYRLTEKIETFVIDDKTVYSIANGALLICLEKNLTLPLMETLIAKSPTMIICLDEGFQNNDQLKVNVMQTIKTHNQQHEGNILFRVV
jgi:adenine-specific DNA-methyltransferase